MMNTPETTPIFIGSPGLEITDVSIEATAVDLSPLDKIDPYGVSIRIERQQQHISDGVEKISGRRFGEIYVNEIVQTHAREITESRFRPSIGPSRILAADPATIGTLKNGEDYQPTSRDSALTFETFVTQLIEEQTEQKKTEDVRVSRKSRPLESSRAASVALINSRNYYRQLISDYWNGHSPTLTARSFNKSIYQCGRDIGYIRQLIERYGTLFIVSVLGIEFTVRSETTRSKEKRHLDLVQ